MDRLTLLKRERDQISKMQTLSFSLKDQCEEWYDNEIRAIEEYGSANPEVTPPTEHGIMDEVDRLIKQVVIKVTETTNDFAFETILPWCETVTQDKLSKKDLEEALRMWTAAKEKRDV